MSLYDGLEEKAQKDSKPDLVGWSSGIKLLQSQLQLKKAALTQTKREQFKKSGAVLPPVLDLKSRREEDDENKVPILGLPPKDPKGGSSNMSLLGGDWDPHQEYDPRWPNDYERVMRDREKRAREREKERFRGRDDSEEKPPFRRNERYSRRDRYERSNKDFDRGSREFARPPREEEEYEEERPRRGMGSGAAIAPPPSLIESPERKENVPLPSTPFASGSSVAARIMAKYGFKEGQGLGKKEQGMSIALQVEKTSKRGGKIIHEKDLPKFAPDSPEFQEPPAPPPPACDSPAQSTQVDSITEIMKNPSKVVLLRNMVGPGEVDDDLEGETKEECGKYGDVAKCVIYEITDDGVPEDESVRIFIEFRRLEAAIKAVVDLNGRYFGGRIVKAGFYNIDRFQRHELGD